MLNLAVRNTKKLIRERSREENIRIGRFFTKKGTAALMSVMFRSAQSEHITILDPGAGTGILSAALLERLCLGGGLKTVDLVCFENDAMMLPMLENNLARLRRRARHDHGVRVTYKIRRENFVLSAAEEEGGAFDYVIMTPPSELLAKDAPEIAANAALCAGATDIAFLFAALGMKMLRAGGEMVSLLPTAYASGVYIDRIRLYLEREAHIAKMHVFAAKAKSAAQADAVRTSFILKFIKAPRTEGAAIAISSSFSDGDGGDITALPPFPYERIVNPKTGALLLLKSLEEAEALARIEAFPETLSSLGLRMRTGLTLESRYRDSLRNSATDGAIPLIHPKSIKDGIIHLPTEKYIIPVIPSLAQKNKNMLFIKRVPAKSDGRHLLCGAYMASQLPHSPMISTHNKLNYIDYADGREMDAQLLFGLYGLLSSDLYENYCTIVSKSPQINATEYEKLPLPDLKTLRAIGQQLLMSRQFSPKICSVVVQNVLRPKTSRML